jgi:hypothetical protein
MKRVSLFFMAALFVGTLAVTVAGAQNAPLGDYARQVRKQKAAPATKTFDNDTLPASDKLSVVGQAPDPADANSANSNTQGSPQDANAAPASADAAASNANGEQKSSLDEEQAKKQALWKEWQTKIQKQRDAVDLANREVDVANREYRLRAAAFYADAGNRLRNSGAWDKEDSQYKDQIASKQKALDDAKKVLDDMQEDARKAGVPSSMRE